MYNILDQNTYLRTISPLSSEWSPCAFVKIDDRLPDLSVYGAAISVLISRLYDESTSMSMPLQPPDIFISSFRLTLLSILTTQESPTRSIKMASIQSRVAAVSQIASQYASEKI